MILCLRQDKCRQTWNTNSCLFITKRKKNLTCEAEQSVKHLKCSVNRICMFQLLLISILLPWENHLQAVQSRLFSVVCFSSWRKTFYSSRSLYHQLVFHCSYLSRCSGKPSLVSSLARTKTLWPGFILAADSMLHCARGVSCDALMLVTMKKMLDELLRLFLRCRFKINILYC